MNLLPLKAIFLFISMWVTPLGSFFWDHFHTQHFSVLLIHLVGLICYFQTVFYLCAHISCQICCISFVKFFLSSHVLHLLVPTQSVHKVDDILQMIRNKFDQLISLYIYCTTVGGRTRALHMSTSQPAPPPRPGPSSPPPLFDDNFVLRFGMARTFPVSEPKKPGSRSSQATIYKATTEAKVSLF